MTKFFNLSVSGILSAILVFLEPTLPFIIFLLLLWVYDMISAVKLQKKLYRNGLVKNPPKYQSSQMRTSVGTLTTMFLAIISAHFLDYYVFHFVDIHLANWTTGVCAFVELFSILENKIATSDSKLAKLLKKIMVDKASKWIDMDKSEIEETLK